MNNTGKEKKCQDHLVKPTEKKLKMPVFIEFMEDKKLKLDRLKECGNFISFIANKDKTNFRLAGGNFCKNRFCPVCSWLKARKNAFEILELLRAIQKKEDKRFIFVTLTIPNVEGNILSETIKNLNKSFKRLTELDEIKKMNFGYIRKVEVTYQGDEFVTRENKKSYPKLKIGTRLYSYNTYHPHLHVIFAVNKSYETSRYKIPESKWLELWKKSARDDSITQVNVKSVRMGSVKEVMEMATYSAKQSELYLNKDVFDNFYDGLYRKKLLTYNGLFKEYRKLQDLGELETDDEELESLKEKASTELGYMWKLQEYREMFEKELDADDKRTLYKIKIDVD